MVKIQMLSFKHLSGITALSVAASAMGQTAEDIPLPPVTHWAKAVVALEAAGPEPRFVFAGLLAHSYGGQRSSPYLYYTDKPDAEGITKVTAISSPYRKGQLCQRIEGHVPDPENYQDRIPGPARLNVLGTVTDNPVRVLPALGGTKLDATGASFNCSNTLARPLATATVEMDTEQAARLTWLLRNRHASAP